MRFKRILVMILKLTLHKEIGLKSDTDFGLSFLGMRVINVLSQEGGIKELSKKTGWLSKPDHQ